jgi:hypothetical protein
MGKAEIEALHANSPYRIPAPSKATRQACRAARGAVAPPGGWLKIAASIFPPI